MSNFKKNEDLLLLKKPKKVCKESRRDNKDFSKKRLNDTIMKTKTKRKCYLYIEIKVIK